MMSSNPSTRTRMVAILAEILEIDPKTVHGKQRLREDLGMDSLASLELLSTISEQLELDLEMEDAMTLTTVDDACAFIDRHMAEQRQDTRVEPI